MFPTDREARIVIIVPEYNKGRWQVNLTDGRRVWGMKHYVRADAALGYVQHLIRQGHRPAFLSAIVDLLADATLAPPMAAD